MAQSSFDDDDLFGEAADEMRDAVEEHLANARASLPDPDAVWETDADNVLGALNGLNAALDAGDAVEELRAAKKQYVMGERADAFDDADDLAEAIEDLEELVETLEEAHGQVSDLTSAIPQLRGDLEDAHEAAEAGGTDADDADDADADGTDVEEAEAEA